MKESETYIKEISETEIVTEQCKLDKVPLQTIKGTMKLHQLITELPCIITHRNVSCGCEGEDICIGHDILDII